MSDKAEDTPAHGPDLRSYGRRRGRALSARQKDLWQRILPRVALPSDVAALTRPAELFDPKAREVWLELGFGGGEHLVWQAAHNAQAGLIGCEPFEDGVIKVLDAVDRQGLGNIRIHADDGRPILRLLPQASIDRVFILFPDPWPKARHHKRRLLSPPTLRELARVMPAGAELRVATDIGGYARAILLAVRAEGSFAWGPAGPDDWRRRADDWPPTRYEEKAMREGRRSYYFRFIRR